MKESKSRLSSSALYQRDRSPEDNGNGRVRGMTSSNFNINLNRVESKYPDENAHHVHRSSIAHSNYQKDEKNLLVFDKPIVESKVLLR